MMLYLTALIVALGIVFLLFAKSLEKSSVAKV